MTTHKPNTPDQHPEFDAFAENYDEALQQGLDLTGESKEYFAAQRVHCMKRQLDSVGAASESILDFGCGTGGSVSYLLEIFSPTVLIGTDISDDSLSIARQNYSLSSCRFEILDQFQPKSDLDLAFCNGVFHHIPVAERQQCADKIFQSLRQGGYFCFWENNPWNPGTRWIMKRVPFDRDAIMLWPKETRSLLKASGFEIVKTSFLFFFPNLLKVLRPIEPLLASIPLGGQYLVFARKP